MVDLHCHLNLPLNRILFKLFFIYSRSKNITVADINNRLGKITNNPATLYARISCTRSFLAWRNKVELIYIRPIWKKKKCFLPTGTLEKGKFREACFLGQLHGIWKREVPMSGKVSETAGPRLSRKSMER